MITGQLAAGQSLSLASILELNRSLTGSGGQMRTRRVLGECDGCLPPDFFEEAIQILEQDILADLVRAGRVYISIATVHPFDDGNGRTARLAADWILLQHGWLPRSFQSAQQVSERTPGRRFGYPRSTEFRVDSPGA